MNINQNQIINWLNKKWYFLYIIIITVISRGLVILFLPQSSFSYDLKTWNIVSKCFTLGQNPYISTKYVNWPPFWMQIIFICNQLSKFLNIPLDVIIRIFFLVIEVICIYLIIKISKKYLNSGKIAHLIIIIVVLNPIFIILNYQHGQFDVVVSLWVLLFLYFLMEYNESNGTISWLFACLSLGIAILTKTIPFVLLPFLFYKTYKLNKRIKLLGLLLSIGPTALGMSIIFALSPEHIFKKVILPNAVCGYFGISGFLRAVNLDGLIPLYSKIFTMLLFIFLIWISIFLYKYLYNIDNNHLLVLVFLHLIIIPILGPAYGPQYIYWYLYILILIYFSKKLQWKKLFIIYYVTAIITYLIEYSLFPSHGAFLINAFNLKNLNILSNKLYSNDAQTLLRLPLLFLSLLLIFKGLNTLKYILKK